MDTATPAAALAMPTELWLLGWSVVLALVMLAVHILTATPDLGLKTAVKPRDDNPQLSGVLAGRAKRAWLNFMETYPLFVALTLGLVVSGQTGGIGLWGAELWFLARLVYAPIYYAGIPWLRTLVFVGSILGLILMVFDLLT
ncbi:MAPEG family protein [Aurantimonas sp. VKM B-3413]|uniref:MAPEG family protein n=1 Tax=Aurantimonas sp. VKM B-3413 TaxID=2779401 RepID=UPI001E3567FA|nr:MAPEG family protein [Aurantimonas sp. VKM B-3413]MCB8840606.1 MAPEG family protein [Aurantimonas sp. VKM B-3413]